MTHTKMKFLLKIIYNTFPTKIIGKQLLPIKDISIIFKNYKIT